MNTVIRNEIGRMLNSIGCKPSETGVADGVTEWLTDFEKKHPGAFRDLCDGGQIEPGLRELLRNYLEGKVADRRARACRR